MFRSKADMKFHEENPVGSTKKILKFIAHLYLYPETFYFCQFLVPQYYPQYLFMY